MRAAPHLQTLLPSPPESYSRRKGADLRSAGDGRSAPRDRFLHTLAQEEVWPQAAGGHGEATGREGLAGSGRGRLSLDTGERLLGHSNIILGAGAFELQKTPRALKIKRLLSSTRGHQVVFGTGAPTVAHMQPPTPCLWHCCPSLTQPQFSREKRKEIRIIFPLISDL